MKKLWSIALLCVGMLSGVMAEPYTPIKSLEEILSIREESGKYFVSFDLDKLQEAVLNFEKHARTYPVTFDSRMEQQQAIDDVILVDMLSVIYPFNEDIGTLQLFLRFNAVAYNLDHNPLESLKRFDKTANLLLELKEDDASLHNFIANFQASTGQYEYAKTHFKRAIELGDTHSYYGLGLVYLSQDQDEKALEAFKVYQKHFPNTRMIDEVIKAVESGNYSIESP
ncbi:tetratricopeptide repeat protein [Ignatzschineria sp. RMDPL8A]|uniref:tetratricopeptide repeat protein n=1 Tax=Ignatzschineria sp. RMDPL8A TaxID=2999236 RepID=UPI0024467879|nr:tetratricopeptide repeat protein [Ignatzschineria sp. RMDPL8A]MDG9728850.1 tetratricopeptide repeat protein [Ignatzschineria sp. RMDPL8A]